MTPKIPFLGSANTLSGQDHRVNLWLSLGHTLHVLHSRRLTFGLYVLTGLTHYASEGHFTNSREMIADSFSTANDILALGVRLKVAIDSAAT